MTEATDYQVSLTPPSRESLLLAADKQRAVVESIVIDSHPMLEAANDELGSVIDRRKTLEAELKRQLEPVAQIEKNLRGLFNPVIKTYAELEDNLRGAMLTYQNAERKKREEEQRQREEAARQERERIQREAARVEAEQRAKAEEERRRAAAVRAEQDRKEAEAQAERDRLAREAEEARARGDREAAEKARKDAEEIARKTAQERAAADKKAADLEVKAENTAIAGAQQALELEQTADLVVAPVVEEAPKVSGFSSRTVWKARISRTSTMRDAIMHIASHPMFEDLLLINESQLNTLAKAMGRKIEVALPWCEAYEETVSVKRSK